MNAFTRDPLLGIARGLLNLLAGLFAVGGIACVIAMPIMLLMKSEVTMGIAEEAEVAAVAGAAQDTFWMIMGILAIATVVLALSFYFTRHFKRIVDTVAIGDPFIPANARRLTAMAWLMLAIQTLVIPLAAIGIAVARILDGSEADVSLNLSMSGLILVLTLFILARVFRTGAQMREDLEGTV